MKWLMCCALGGALIACVAPPQGAAPPASLSRPQALIFTQAGLVVANSGYQAGGWAPGRLTLIDPQSGARLAEIPTPHRNPQRIVRRGGWLYVVQTGALDFSEPAAPRTGPGGIAAFAVDELGPNSAPLTLDLLDPAAPSGAIDLAFIEARGLVTLATQPYALLFDADRLAWLRGPDDPISLGDEGVSLAAVAAWRDLFLVVEFNHDRLFIIEADGARWPCVVDLGRSRDLEGAQSPVVAGETLYTLMAMTGELRAVDLTALAALGPQRCDEIQVRSALSPLGQVPNDLHVRQGRAYVVQSGDNNVVAYDLASGRAAARWRLAPGSNPWHMAFDDEGRFAVSEWGAEAISFFEEGVEAAYLRVAGAPPLSAPEATGISYTARCADVVVEAPGATGEGLGDPQRAINGVRGGGVQVGGADVYSLDPGEGRSALVLRWSGRVVEDGPGDDLVIFENPFEYAEGIFMDLMVVEVSTDGVRWQAFPYDYLAEDEARYSADPRDWAGFAGRTPVSLNVEGAALDPMDEAAGGDRFDLADLQGALGEEIRREGARYVRLRPAMSLNNPDTGAPFPADPISDGPDIDGVCARQLTRTSW
ncbi:LIC_13355 family lipoprotein [Myxococcota bacterium]|nr:LIC_13355 family lipoprotein [Myxococcota bacterium]MBU1899228.1 LIC_13355 family lipoprotein [Myxococcota bacterium]